MPRPRPEKKPTKSKYGALMGRPPMKIDEHSWWRKLRSVDPEDVDGRGFVVKLGVGADFERCWKYDPEASTSVMHHGKTRELRPTLFVELSPNRDAYLDDPYAYFLVNGDEDPRIGERLALNGGIVSQPDKWCGHEWCYNPVHTAMVRRGEWLGVKRDLARERYAAIKSERDAPVREIRVERPMGAGFVAAGELADDMYWSAARRGVMITGWYEEDGVWRWKFDEGVHWAVKQAFLDRMKECADPVAVRAGMLEPSPLPDDQVAVIEIKRRAHDTWNKYRAWQRSWQKNDGVVERDAKSRAKLSRRIPARPGKGVN